jgi:membrane-bound lytic murein transglycosylase B
MLGVWGVESAFGDPVVQQHHMRPVIPSLATLAWAEPRRRDYWRWS